MAADRDGEMGIGLGTPSPTGLSMKYWTSRETAYDLFAEWSFSDKRLNLHFDYLIHSYGSIFMDDAESPLYYGFGARFNEESGKDVVTGIRFPVGISYLPNSLPFELYAEGAARLDLTPSTNFGIDLVLGVRYRINAQRSSSKRRPMSRPINPMQRQQPR
jgi:hypothetical protein